MKKLKRSRVVFGLFLVTVCGLFSFDSPNERYYDIARNLEILTSVYQQVNKYYVDDVDPNTLMQKGINAMLSSLDPYTNYIPEDDIEDFRFISTGQYGGIGALIGNRKGKVVVLMPYEGFPANKAGLNVGDIITEIDGVDTYEKNTSDISKLLKGQAGTEVNVKVKRLNSVDTLSLTLIREKITVHNVPYHGMVNDEIGYFQLTTFTNDASKNIKEAIEDLKAQGAKKLIFDLRGNTGGLLFEAINICNLFLNKGEEVVSTRGKVDKWNKVYKAPSSPLDIDIPLVILTNGRSASASEIVSGVMQDYDRAVLIGSKTFGKGLVQATFETAHRSQVKVTTAKYYIPSGRCIQAIDYSNRDDNGKAHHIPDSLLTKFKTKNGRVVLDGEGITPDIEMADTNVYRVVRELVSRSLIFDYATQYYYDHPKIVEAKKFKLTNADFDHFVKWLKTQEFSYKIDIEEKLLDFEDQLKKDSLHLHISNELRIIEKEIEKEKHTELLASKDVIIEVLEKEIASHYYLQKGIIEASFDDDRDILKAIEVLNSKEKRNTILGVK